MKEWEGDVSVKGSTVFATLVKIDAIDASGLEVNAKVKKSTDQEFEFLVMFLKNGEPISSDSDLSGFAGAKSIVKSFANELSREATKDYHKAETKIFTNLENDLESAKRDKEKAEKAIENAKKVIKEKTAFLSENKTNQEELVKKISEQKKVVKKANEELDLFK